MKQLELKDLGAVARRIVYGEPSQVDRPQRIYSCLLDDYFFRTANGSTVFESGVVYTADEINRLKGTAGDTLKRIHTIKKIFHESRIIQ